jgi:hypothetical protein
MIVSHLAYSWFITLLTGLVAVYWIGIDSYRLKKALGGDRSDPAIRDRIFGSTMGIVIGFVGVVGVLMHVAR